MKSRLKFVLLGSSTFLIFLTSAHSQTIWDGNGDANASGNWNTNPTFWSTDLAPISTANVQLNNVTTGTRIVTLDSAGVGKTLSLTQSPGGAVNRLDISSTLTLGTTNTTETILATTNTSGSPGGTVLNLNSGGSITVTATGAKTFQNAGTLNFNGGSILVNIGNNIAANRTFTNTGIVNVTATSGFTNTNSNTSNLQATGLFTNSSGAQLNVSAGTFTFGNANTAANARAGTIRLSNSGAVTVDPAASLVIKNNGSLTAGETNVTEFNNLSGSTFTLGSASSATGKATLSLNVTGSQVANFTTAFNNTGTATVYGQSVVNFAYPSNSTKGVNITNNAGGILNLTPNSVGIILGSDGAVTGDIRHSITVTNSGTMNVASFDPLSTGLVRIGQVATAGRDAVRFTTAADAITNIGINTTVQALNRISGTSVSSNNVEILAAGTVNLGASGNTTAGGILQQSSAASTTGTFAPTSASAAAFSNSGTVNAYGTSAIELATTSVNNAALNTHTVTNLAGANLNLYDTSRIGNTTKNTAFSNAGTLTKHNAGTAEIRSAAGGTNTNTGDITVTAGTLEFSLGLSSGTGTITVASGAQLTAGGSGLNLTSGTLTGNGAINSSTTIAGTLSPGTSPGNLTFNNGLNLSGIYKWELGALSTIPSDYDRVTVTVGDVNIAGASFLMDLGLLAPSGDPFWSTDQTWAGIVNLTGANSLLGTFTITNDQTPWASLGGFSTTYTDNDVNLVWTAVPEPSGALLAGGLGFLAILRRRRS